MTASPGRRILLGITGGIAAYKAAELTRLLIRSGQEVRVVMTRGATEFIRPLTLQALSGHPVHLDLLDSDAEAGMGHIELARWPDQIIVAPASADFIARTAGGRADDLLAALLLATTAPVTLAPAMNQGMWQNAATRHNVETLRQRGLRILGPAEGEQACGELGPGRMLEPGELLEALLATARKAPPGQAPQRPGESAGGERFLEGLHIVLTGGPTREALDPVRYISNESSGKMAYALARQAALAGARVTLISGPVSLPSPPGVERIDVTTAREMLEASLKYGRGCDVFIGVAAVADYRPATSADQKIKKQGETMQLELQRNPDIISTIASLKEQRPFTVGFAAETEALGEFGRDKLLRKKLDLLFANDATSTFGSETTTATALWPEGGHPDDESLAAGQLGGVNEAELGPASKEAVAADMLKLIRKRRDLARS